MGSFVLTGIFTIIVGFVVSFLSKRKQEQSKFPRKHTLVEAEGGKKSKIIPSLTQEISSFQNMDVKIVAISDTHGHHRQIEMPTQCDILIHAGDFTQYGDKEQAEDFNNWLGELPYKYKFVVNGNHEHNAPWRMNARNILSNATLLVDESVDVDLDIDSDVKADAKKKLRIHGMSFSWPLKSGRDPRFEKISDNVDILISHCPAEAYVDQKRGCPGLTKAVEKVKPKVLICGHEHNGRGVVENAHTTFVNSATARNGNTFGQQPIILLL